MNHISIISPTKAAMLLVVLLFAAGFFVLPAADGFAAPARSKAALAAQSAQAVRYMRRLKKPLLSAARTGSGGQFLRFIQSHANLKAIGDYSLGRYRPRLRKSRSGYYYRGVSRFMARYFAKTARKYKVVAAVIRSARHYRDKSWYVDSVVTLKDGSNYNVRWQLTRYGQRFRIENVQVLGFWLAWFQKILFEDYISRNNSNVEALVKILNR
jgi:phospholipid transport system substrate-binding protein